MMFTFYMFRIKAYKPEQRQLFGDDKTSSEAIYEMLSSKPSAELRKGYIWHIGNIIKLKKDAFYFALGRTTKSINERYDENEGNFIEEDFETSPYTHVVIDLDYQIVGIAQKTRLAPTAKGIAHQLERLLNDSEYIKSYGGRVEVSDIGDPEDFVSYLINSYSVSKFTMEFGEPNPWDANKDFQSPMQKLLQASSGETGQTTVKGNDLNRETLEVLSRATASTGNNAKAVIKVTEDSKGCTKHLKGNPATVSEESVNTKEERADVLSKLRDYYKRIRQLPDE